MIGSTPTVENLSKELLIVYKTVTSTQSVKMFEKMLPKSYMVGKETGFG